MVKQYSSDSSNDPSNPKFSEYIYHSFSCNDSSNPKFSEYIYISSQTLLVPFIAERKEELLSKNILSTIVTIHRIQNYKIFKIYISFQILLIQFRKSVPFHFYHRKKRKIIIESSILSTAVTIYRIQNFQNMNTYHSNHY